MKVVEMLKYANRPKMSVKSHIEQERQISRPLWVTAEGKGGRCGKFSFSICQCGTLTAIRMSGRQRNVSRSTLSLVMGSGQMIRQNPGEEDEQHFGDHFQLSTDTLAFYDISPLVERLQKFLFRVLSLSFWHPDYHFTLSMTT